MERRLEKVSEELFIQAFQPLLYLDDDAPDYHKHRVDHKLDAADPLDQLALHPVQVARLRVHLILQVKDLRYRLRDFALHVLYDMVLASDAALTVSLML